MKEYFFIRIIYRIYLVLPSRIRSRFYKFFKKGYLKGKRALTQGQIFNVKVNASDSFKMKNFGGHIENEIYKYGLFETWENDLGWIWMELCQFSNTIIDVGANTGVYSLVAKTINPKSRIISFEPSIHTYKKLLYNVQLNNLEVICEKLAVSNMSGRQLYFDLPDENQTTASLSPEKMKNWKGYTGEILEYPVETIRLADYLKAKNLNQIDLIKIDIEMHEPEALEGLGQYLSKLKPIIVFEILSREVATKLKPLVNLDEFLLFHLRKDKIIEKLYEVKMADNSIEKGEWNYLLIPKEKLDLIKANKKLSDKIELN